MISESQKQIYNSFLHITRSVKNQPYRARKDFTDIDDTTLLHLKKLDSFFNNYQHIKYRDFFIAPYSIYSKEEYFDLQFYCTMRAVKCYSMFVQRRELADPDHDATINDCKQCCSFIYKFCKDNSLSLSQYKNSFNGKTPLVLQHLKDHKINFYVVQGLEIHSLLQTIEPQIVNFIINDFFSTYNTTKNNFIKSTKLKTVVRAALKIVDEKLLHT